MRAAIRSQGVHAHIPEAGTCCKPCRRSRTSLSVAEQPKDFRRSGRFSPRPMSSPSVRYAAVFSWSFSSPFRKTVFIFSFTDESASKVRRLGFCFDKTDNKFLFGKPVLLSSVTFIERRTTSLARYWSFSGFPLISHDLVVLSKCIHLVQTRLCFNGFSVEFLARQTRAKRSRWACPANACYFHFSPKKI